MQYIVLYLAILIIARLAATKENDIAHQGSELTRWKDFDCDERSDSPNPSADDLGELSPTSSNVSDSDEEEISCASAFGIDDTGEQIQGYIPFVFSLLPETDIQERRRKNLTHLLEFVSEMGLPIKLSEKMPLHPVLDLIPMIFNTYGVAAGPKHWRKIVPKKKQGIPTRVVYVGRIQCTIQGTEDML